MKLTKEQILEQAIEHYYSQEDDWGYGQMDIDRYVLPKYNDSDKFFYAKKVTTVDYECSCREVDYDNNACTCGAPCERTITTDKNSIFVFPKS